RSHDQLMSPRRAVAGGGRPGRRSGGAPHAQKRQRAARSSTSAFYSGRNEEPAAIVLALGVGGDDLGGRGNGAGIWGIFSLTIGPTAAHRAWHDAPRVIGSPRARDRTVGFGRMLGRLRRWRRGPWRA